MLDRSQLPLAVSHADVASHMSFHSAANYFQTGRLDPSWWKDVRTLTGVTTPLTLAERAFIVVEGDIAADVTVSRGGAVVVYGDLHASVQTTDNCEVVIAGDVCKGASVSGDGILRLFVGGDLAGRLHSGGSCKAWVQGHLRGEVWTGHPITELRVGGECTAAIRPAAKPSLLYLEVGGFMAFAALEAAAAVGYTEFNASVGKSDRPAGLYPDRATCAALKQHRSYNRWVIRDTVDAGS